MSWDNLSALANKATRNTFGRAVTIGGESVAKAIFAADAREVQLAADAPLQITQVITLQYRTADLTTQPTAGVSASTVVVGSTSYKVLKILPDADGWTTLQLRLAT